MKNIFYLDMYLLNNTIINYTLIFFSVKANKLSVYRFRIIIISLLAVLLSLSVLFFDKYALILFKATMPIAMCHYSVKKASIRQTSKLVITFWVNALILSGIFSILNLSINFTTINNVNYGITSYSAICIAILMLYTLCKYILQLLSRQFLTKNTYKTVEIVINNTSTSLIGFCDSGNSLIEKGSGLPIFVSEKNCLQHIIDFENIPHSYTNCTTILGSGEIPVIKPDVVKIDGVEVKALLGISKYNFCSDYDILLNPMYQTISTTNSFKETENIYA